MDYWRHVEWRRWGSWREFVAQLRAEARLWFIESGGPRHYAEVAYGPDDYLVFAARRPACPRRCWRSIVTVGCGSRCCIPTPAP